MYDTVKKAAEERKDPFLVLLMAKIYKLARPMNLDYKKLHEELWILSMLARSFDADPNGFPQEEKVMIVMESLRSSVKGIGCGVASAFLHFYNDKIPIIDRYSYAVFLKESRGMGGSEIKSRLKNKVFKVNDYRAFYQWYRKKFPSTADHKDTNFRLMEEGNKILGGKRKNI